MTAPIRPDVSGRGALAAINPACVRRGLAAVRTGEVRSLGLPIRHGAGPVGPRRQPPQHFMVRDGGDAAIQLGDRHGFSFSEDVVILPTHGTTHLDALCHVWRDGEMYGGIPAETVNSRGASRLGIDEAGPIVTRVLIVDAVPEGQSWLDAGEAVSLELIQKRLATAGLRPESGDALFIRTGWLSAWRAKAQGENSWGGLDSDAIDWILESGFSVIGADNIGVERSPSGDPDCAVPLHLALLRDHGVYFCEFLDLDSFEGTTISGMLTISPLNLVGATASPVNPVVVL